MKQDNFAVEPLVLIQQKTVPDDATIVVIAGPTTDFFPPEIEALNAYVAKGGKVMVMLDPLLKGPGAAAARCSSSPTGASAPARTSSSTRAAWARCSAPTRRCRWRRSIRRIRSPKASASITAYPMARSMTPIEGGSNGHTAQPLVNTSAQSWSEADLASLSTGKAEVGFNADKGDKQGPITLGAAVSAPATVTPPPSGNATPGVAGSEREARNPRRRGRRLRLRRRTWPSASPAIATSS